MPPPSVNPAMPVLDTRPPVMASPNAWVSWSTSRPGAAALGARRAAGRVDAHAGHRREVDDDAAVAGREARDAVAAAADGDGEVLAAREADRRA